MLPWKTKQTNSFFSGFTDPKLRGWCSGSSADRSWCQGQAAPRASFTAPWKPWAQGCSSLGFPCKNTAKLQQEISNHQGFFFFFSFFACISPFFWPSEEWILWAQCSGTSTAPFPVGWQRHLEERNNSSCGALWLPLCLQLTHSCLSQVSSYSTSASFPVKSWKSLVTEPKKQG